ncbi:cytochrome c oxidase subunit 1 [Striga asiatica]|uniref:Cytochrome c oxidase subunit 1 n=1 Tax=Striga asiatica TaxID=4170 RepID=A0A5A7P2N6_STRAF|nr:cytochrome c oxidase subunit 1 [Striga asiatica]
MTSFPNLNSHFKLLSLVKDIFVLTNISILLRSSSLEGRAVTQHVPPRSSLLRNSESVVKMFLFKFSAANSAAFVPPCPSKIPKKACTQTEYPSPSASTTSSRAASVDFFSSPRNTAGISSLGGLFRFKTAAAAADDSDPPAKVLMSPPIGLWSRNRRGEEDLGEQMDDEEDDGEKAGEFDIATAQEDIFISLLFSERLLLLLLF